VVRRASVPFRILSDGFDHNLDRLQTLNGVRFAYTANHLRIEHGKWRIEPAHPTLCGCGTGVCKRQALLTLRAASPRTHLVHIGNGRVSDTCGALAADTAFAKDSLAEELAKRDVPFVRFATLHDVVRELDAIHERVSR
jgi:2-hydroxy-3-keto-5-methylthiopentenyl-1-phosphate phosphatase